MHSVNFASKIIYMWIRSDKKNIKMRNYMKTKNESFLPGKIF